MQLMVQLSKNSRFWLVLFFSLYFILGLLCFRDYGISWDERPEKLTGIVNANYVLESLCPSLAQKVNEKASGMGEKIPNLHDYSDKDYGIFLQMPMLAAEALTGFALDSRTDWWLRHFITFFYFFLATLALFDIIRLVFQSSFYGLMGAAMLILSPRFFAESFYNIKDVGFLSIMIMATWSLFRFFYYPKWRYVLLVGFMAAAATAVRIIGFQVVLMASLIFLLQVWVDRKVLNRQRLGMMALLWGVFVACTILFYLGSWHSPGDFFVSAIQRMSAYPWSGQSLFMGQYYKALSIPWYYLPVWIGITTPLVYLALFMVGTAGSLWQGIRFIKHRSAEAIPFIVFLVMFFVPLLGLIVLKSALYNGWRQCYFLYFPLLMLSVSGIWFLMKAIRVSKIRSTIWSVLIVSFCATGFWMFMAHPYQNAYFNILAGHNIERNFEKDYWGLSILEGYRHILKTDGRDSVVVTSLRAPFLEVRDLLDPETRSRLHFSLDRHSYHYYVSILYEHPTDSLDVFIGQDSLVFEKRIPNAVFTTDFPILRVYKRLDGNDQGAVFAIE